MPFLQRHWRPLLVVVFVLWSWQVTGALWKPLLALLVAGAGWVAWWTRKRLQALTAAGMPRPTVVDLLRSLGRESKRKAQLARQWEVACRARNLTGGGKTKYAPRLLTVTPTLSGDLVARIAPGRIGVDLEDIVKNSYLIAQTVGCREVKVRPTTPGCAEVTFHWTDPVGRILTLAELPMPRGDGQLVYATREDGTAATVSLEAGPVLVAAVSGAGKSNTIETMLADLNRRKVWVQVFVSDPKGGMELSAFEKHVGEWRGRFQVAYYAKNVAETVKMVDELLRLMRQRQAAIRATGRRKLTSFTQEMPLIVVIFDDLLTTLPILSKSKPGEQSHLMVLLTESRSAAIFPVGAAQIAHATTLGDIRNAFPQRLGLRLPSVHAVATVLSESAVAQGAMCHRLHPIEHRGVGWSTNEENHVERFRSPIVTDEDLAEIVEGRAPKGMKTRSDAPVPFKRCAVYRLYGKDRELLYVGISQHPRRRFVEHASKPWWSEVDPAATEIAWLDDEKSAKVEERRAIRDELPLHNTAHNRANPLRWRPWRRADAPEDAPEVVEGPVVESDVPQVPAWGAE